jgi:hypothetical protein
MMEGCSCDNNVCCWLFSTKQIYDVRKKFVYLPQDKLKQYKWDLMMSSKVVSDDDEVFFDFKLLGYEICPRFFMNAYCISSTMFYEIKKLIIQDVVDCPPDLRSTIVRSSHFSDNLRVWFSLLINCIGDFQPDSTEVHLPPQTTKSQVYDSYWEDCFRTSQDVASMSLFYQVWREWFPNLKVKEKARLGKCDECVIFQAHIKSSPLNLRQHWQSLLVKHIDKVKAERLFKIGLDHISSQQPTISMSVTNDFKNPLRLPHLSPLPKSLFAKMRPKLEVHGLINYGLGKYFCFHF